MCTAHPLNDIMTGSCSVLQCPSSLLSPLKLPGKETVIKMITSFALKLTYFLHSAILKTTYMLSTKYHLLPVYYKMLFTFQFSDSIHLTSHQGCLVNHTVQVHKHGWWVGITICLCSGRVEYTMCKPSSLFRVICHHCVLKEGSQLQTAISILMIAFRKILTKLQVEFLSKFLKCRQASDRLAADLSTLRRLQS